jgi:hypothetical protein
MLQVDGHITPTLFSAYLQCLQATKSYRSAFDKLLNDYEAVGEALPHFSRFHSRLGDRVNVQALLSIVYEDMMDFHGRLYTVFRSRCRFLDHNLIRKC